MKVMPLPFGYTGQFVTSEQKKATSPIWLLIIVR